MKKVNIFEGYDIEVDCDGCCLRGLKRGLTLDDAIKLVKDYYKDNPEQGVLEIKWGCFEYPSDWDDE